MPPRHDRGRRRLCRAAGRQGPPRGAGGPRDEGCSPTRPSRVSAAATWDQFDLERGIWTKPAHTTKQKRMERAPLSSQALALPEAIRKEADKENPYVFPGNATDKPLNDIKRFWSDIQTKAKLGDVRLHDLRHTYASHLVSAGESLAIVGRLLGHTQPQTTQRYAHLADDPLRAATDKFGTTLDSI